MDIFFKIMYFSSFKTKIADSCKVTFEWEKVHSVTCFCVLLLRFVWFDICICVTHELYCTLCTHLTVILCNLGVLIKPATHTIPESPELFQYGTDQLKFLNIYFKEIQRRVKGSSPIWNILSQRQAILRGSGARNCLFLAYLNISLKS